MKNSGFSVGIDEVTRNKYSMVSKRNFDNEEPKKNSKQSPFNTKYVCTFQM